MASLAAACLRGCQATHLQLYLKHSWRLGKIEASSSFLIVNVHFAFLEAGIQAFVDALSTFDDVE